MTGDTCQMGTHAPVGVVVFSFPRGRRQLGTQAPVGVVAFFFPGGRSQLQACEGISAQMPAHEYFNYRSKRPCTPCCIPVSRRSVDTPKNQMTFSCRRVSSACHRLLSSLPRSILHQIFRAIFSSMRIESLSLSRGLRMQQKLRRVP